MYGSVCTGMEEDGTDKEGTRWSGDEYNEGDGDPLSHLDSFFDAVGECSA